MTIYSTSQARAKLFEIVESVATSHEPVYIHGRRHTAVIIDKEDYESLQETLYLQSIPGMVAKIQEGSDEPLEEAISHAKAGW